LIFSEPFAKIAARKFARQLQKIGFDVRFSNFKVVNKVTITNLTSLGYFLAKSATLILKGNEQVPNTLTTLKLLNLTSKPIFCNCLANFLAAIFATLKLLMY
jgi:hypothetical protein